MKSLSQRYEIAEFIKEQYGDDPEYLWVKTPNVQYFVICQIKSGML